MKTNKFNYYSFAELKDKALTPNAEQIDVNTLGSWFEAYGSQYWNGEFYEVDDLRLFPVIQWNEEEGQGEVVRFEFN